MGTESPTNPFRNPAIACELSMRERHALMNSGDWDTLINKALDELTPVDRHVALSNFEQATRW